MKKYLKKEWKWTITTIILGFCYSFFMGMTSLCFMSIFEGVSNKNMKEAFISTGLLLLANILLRIFEFLEVAARSNTIERLNNHLRNDISKKILKKNFEQFQKNNTGDYISWYINDVTQAEQLGFEVFFDFCFTLGSILTGVVLLLRFHYGLLILSIVGSGIIIYTSKKMDASMKKKSEEMSNTLEKFSDNMKEQINGIRVLRCFGQMESFYLKMKKESEGLESERKKFEVAKGLGKTIISIENCFLIIINYTILIVMGFMGLVPLSMVMGGTNLLNMVENGTATLGQLRLSMASSKTYFDKLDFDDEKKEEKVALTKEISQIRFEDVSFAYRERNILNKVSFVFEKGKKYALIGKSGSGKTTILRLILGYLSGYTGKICFDELELENIDKDTISEQIAYIEQEVFLFNNTILENITLGKNYDEKELEKILKYSALDKDLTSFDDGIYTIVGENGSKLSGGQKQRIAVARALFHNRTILLVDEGTSALDKENAKIVEDSLLENKNLTLILISHNLINNQNGKFDVIYEI